MDNGALQHPNPPAWHSLDAASVLAQLQTSPDGLTKSQAEARLARFGPNALPRPATRSALRRFLAQFNNLVIHVLLAAGAVTAFLGQWVDSGVIFGVVIINAVIGYVQEGRAEEALAAVRNMLSLQAIVLRDGRQLTLPAEMLVPGDVILLQSGDRVPADARLLESRELRIDEGMLTGESVPSAKAPGPVAADAMLGDRRGMVFSGTLVTAGRGRAAVTGTGTATEIGRISGMLAEVGSTATPLQRKLSEFGRWLTGIILLLCAGTWLFGVMVRGYAAAEMFMAAVGLAVSAIPEALPAIVTITLAVGVRRMASRNAIIRRLPAVETLGAVTVICTDKTGTLTRNEMSVRTVRLGGDRTLKVTGTGYGPGGNLQPGEGTSTVDPDQEPGFRDLCLAGVLCNESFVHEHEGRWELTGDPTEGALLSLAFKAGLQPAEVQAQWPRLDIIPFESEHRLMATLNAAPDGARMIFVKGAPEVILNRCTHQLDSEGERPVALEAWRRHLQGLGDAGERTLALARRAAPGEAGRLDFDDLQDLVLLGVVGISDPPREEATESVRQCAEAGIAVKMVTGDHAGTAGAIARQMGIGDGRAVLSGRELEGLGESLADAAESAAVFARVNPEHKLQLVDALQARGHVVAMTGDGVNDAPALKSADVGVAMGIKGTEAAKEAAQMVLADDNFASIVRAIEEGRTVFDNIRKSFIYILPTNGGECLTILLAIAFGLVLPITPVQILWINLVTEVTLSIALAFEPGEPGIMRRPPRDPRAPILTAFMMWRVLFVSALMVAAAFGLFALETAWGADVDTARTVAVNTLVATQAAYLLNVRLLSDSTLNFGTLRGNRFVWIGIGTVTLLQLFLTYTPFMQALFDTRPLSADAWLRILGAALALYLVVELEKAVIRRIRPRAFD